MYLQEGKDIFETIDRVYEECDLIERLTLLITKTFRLREDIGDRTTYQLETLRRLKVLGYDEAGLALELLNSEDGEEVIRVHKARQGFLRMRDRARRLVSLLDNLEHAMNDYIKKEGDKGDD